MALISTAAAAHVNGIAAPAAEDEELHAQLMRLQDEVLAGTHAQFKLPPAVVAQLKAAWSVPEVAVAGAVAAAVAVNGAAHTANHHQLQSPHAKPNRLPGLHAPAPPSTATHGATSAYAAKAAGLDPIFLQKSDSLVRAEAQLKRQRIERDLQAQVEQRRHAARDRDPGFEAPARIDMNAVLRAAWIRVTPATGLKAARAASVASFDDDDYYSSRAPSEWSSDPSPRTGSDKGADGPAADSERLDANPQAAESSRYAQKRVLPGSAIAHADKDRPHVYTNEPEEVYEVEDDEDDEYIPPDAAAFKSVRGGIGRRQTTPPEDDNSDYEPGEITHESAVPTPNVQPAHPASGVPVIRNHLTHIAAPQPNRVSPLATAKGPNIELELVNGRPEIVQKPQPHPQHRFAPMQSRASTASPSGTGAAGSGKKTRRTKKRKREFQNEGHKPPAKKGRREREGRERVAARALSPVAVPGLQMEPYIKDEPVSPPPFDAAPLAPMYQQQDYRRAPVEVPLPDAGLQRRYVEDPAPDAAGSALRHEYPLPASPSVAMETSPNAYRTVQRDTQDLRRVASLQYAQRPPSPTQQALYSPAVQYRAASAVYGEQRPLQSARDPAEPAVDGPRYRDVPARAGVQYARAPSPPRVLEYRDSYSRVPSPAVMAPPPPPPPARRIVVDQYGNRYYAAEPAPPPSRASLAPRLEPGYERAVSRMSVAYAPQYELGDPRMPPPPTRREPPVEYVDASGYRVAREYSTRPVEGARYAEQQQPISSSPLYQQVPRYEQVPPPPPAPTPPVYLRGGRYEMPPPPPAPTSPGYQLAPTSPGYQQSPRYEQMPPPPVPTSPVYQQSPRYEQMPPPPPVPTSPVYQQAPRYEQMPPPSVQGERTSPNYQPAPRFEQMPPPPVQSERTSPVYQQTARYEQMPPSPAPNERTSPVYQQTPRYEQMPPPPPPPHPQAMREPTSPAYQQVPRAYSVRPEEPQQQVGPGYSRQSSVAPVQYVRQGIAPPASARAGSVMPGAEYGAQQQQPMYGYAPAPPPPVKYVDQYGREVFPQQVRQVSEFRY
ncbi:hypothetical protein LTR08_001376 [Meristemomyces frigidus]|nr:hypothetical protein LTR08_001376 [Meristemomyces frigidus]